MLIYDPEDLGIVEVNIAATKLYGYSQEEMSSLTVKELVPPEDVDKVVEFIRSKEQQFFDSGVWKHQKSNGELLYVHIFTYPLTLEDKTYTLVVEQDVTKRNNIEHQLQTEHELFQLMIDNFPGILFLLDQDVKLLRWNKQVEAITGYKPDELKFRPLNKLFTPGPKAEICQACTRALSEGQAEIECELNTESDDAVPFHLLIHRMVIEGQPHLLGLGLDISTLKKVMRNLEARSQAIENAMDAIAFVDNNGIINDVNRAKVKLYGYQNKEELVGEHWSILYSRKDTAKIKREALEGLEHEDQWKSQVKGQRSDGSTFDIELSVINLDDKGFVAICKDITKRKQRERQIKASLQEKEVMLTEIHHRVKNNLAVVSSMLQLQAFEEEDEKVRTKLLDSVLRIKSMATIHEQLYQAQSFSQIDFSDHVKRLASNILDAHQLGTIVELVFQLDPLVLDVNQAVPCSLIINEVVTNSLKHAFKDMDQGTITFMLSINSSQVKLTIQDNGRGLPEGFNTQKSHTLGYALIDVLVQQLEGEHQYSSTKHGANFTLEFNRSTNNN